MKFIFVNFLFFTVFLFLLNEKAYCDTVIPPYSYTVISSNNKYVFVMLAPKEEFDLITKDKELRETALSIRKKYKRSGLYLNDSSTSPIWTVDWYSYSAILSSDGNYVVRFESWATNLQEEAFGIYHTGELVKSYKVKGLVKNNKLLKYSVSHFKWKCNLYLDEAKNQLQITTLDKNKYVFSLKNGRQMSYQKLKMLSCPD